MFSRFVIHDTISLWYNLLKTTFTPEFWRKNIALSNFKKLFSNFLFITLSRKCLHGQTLKNHSKRSPEIRTSHFWVHPIPDGFLSVECSALALALVGTPFNDIYVVLSTSYLNCCNNIQAFLSLNNSQRFCTDIKETPALCQQSCVKCQHSD